MKYGIRYTSAYRRTYRLAMRRGHDMALLNEVVEKLADGVELEPRHRDHALVGEWAGHRECHITADWLLIYRRFEDVLVLELTATGSHADLFGN